MEYKEVYDKLKSRNEGAFIPFTVLGYPDYEISEKVIKTTIDSGADILELGMPFSDPMADGPTIQEADTVALRNGITIYDCFNLLQEIREISEIPIGLLMYSNLILNYGIDEFYRKLDELNINSVLMADVPIEEAQEYIEKSKKYNIQTVFLITPITKKERMKKILNYCNGFVYLVSRLGVTGAKKDLKESTIDLIKRVRPETDLPLNVGFGISEPKHVRKVINAGADGAIVGSAIVKLIKEYDDEDKMLKKVSSFVDSMKEATKK